MFTGEQLSPNIFLKRRLNICVPVVFFTYFSNEIDSLGRGHQRALFKHFSSVSLKMIDLELPNDIKDTWWADSMVIVKAVK